LTIKDYCTAAHKNAVDKGFYDINRTFDGLCMLIITELAESVEADRIDNWAGDYDDFSEIKDSVQVELADVFIRLFDLCGRYDIDIEKFITEKMHYNSTRVKMHGKRY
jgi:NTP pyrophosphatase (non-canonical NTP hydrolase)